MDYGLYIHDQIIGTYKKAKAAEIERYFSVQPCIQIANSDRESIKWKGREGLN